LLLSWLQETGPEVVCLQETKVQDRDFPDPALKKLGYSTVYRGEKGFNGVAVLSQEPAEVLRFGLDDTGPPDEARLVLVRLCGFSLLNTYVPQGTAPESDRFRYKLDWLGRIRRFLERHFTPDEPLVWVGDFNVAPEKRDVYDPEGLLGSIGFHPEEHRALGEVRQWGFVDLFRLHVDEDGQYTFWDYRVRNALARRMGWRVDHIWATEPMVQRCRGAWIDMGLRRAEKPSDHAPILAEFDVD
jgi:exodeoxyribonuclease-3